MEEDDPELEESEFDSEDDTIDPGHVQGVDYETPPKEVRPRTFILAFFLAFFFFFGVFAAFACFHSVSSTFHPHNDCDLDARFGLCFAGRRVRRRGIL